MKLDRTSLLGIVCASVLVCNGATRASQYRLTYDQAFLAAMQENNAGSIIAHCQDAQCTDGDLFEALGWAIGHEEYGGILVAHAVVTNPEISTYSIDRAVSRAIKANKRGIINVLVKSSKARDDCLVRALDWAIEQDDGQCEDVSILQAIVENRNLLRVSARTGLIHSIRTDKYASIKFLAGALKADEGGLLATLDWAMDHSEGEHGSAVARIAVNNPALDGVSLGHAFYSAIGRNNGEILKILVESRKASSDKLDRTLKWAISHSEDHNAPQIARLVVESAVVSAESINAGIYQAIENSNFRMIRILASSGLAGSRALSDALYHVIDHEGSDRGDVARAIVEHPNMDLGVLRMALYLLVESDKREIGKSLACSEKVDAVGLREILAWAERMRFDDIEAICRQRLEYL